MKLNNSKHILKQWRRRALNSGYRHKRSEDGSSPAGSRGGAPVGSRGEAPRNQYIHRQFAAVKCLSRHWVMTCKIRRLTLTVSDVCLRLTCSQSTSTYSALEVSHFMHYTNLRLTYLRRFVAESVLHLPLPLQKNFGPAQIPWPNMAGPWVGVPTRGNDTVFWSYNRATLLRTAQTRDAFLSSSVITGANSANSCLLQLTTAYSSAPTASYLRLSSPAANCAATYLLLLVICGVPPAASATAVMCWSKSWHRRLKRAERLP